MNSIQTNWVERMKSGKYISPFDYNHPDKVKERNITKCSVVIPGRFKITTNK